MTTGTERRPALSGRDPRLDPGFVPVLDTSRATAAQLRATRGWRVPLRVAWRDSRRHPWRTLLGMLMVGLPVLVLLGAAIGYRTDDLDGREAVPLTLGRADGLVADLQSDGAWWEGASSFRYGGGDGFVQASGTGVQRSREDLEDLLGATLTPLVRGEVSVMDAAGRSARAVGTMYDTGARVTDGIAVVEQGRLPGATDEVAVSPRLARSLDVAVGDRLTVGEREVTAVGVATVPVALGSTEGPQVIGAPDAFPLDPGTASTGHLAQGLPRLGDPRLVTDAFERSGYADGGDRDIMALRHYVDVTAAAQGLAVTHRDVQAWDGGWGSRWSWLWYLNPVNPVLGPVYAVVIILLAVLSTPAVAVGVRQSRRLYALLQGAGADGRALRRTVLAQALVIGAVGSLAGTLLAVGTVAVVVASGWWPLGFRGPLDVRLGDLALALAVPTVSTVIAGVAPAIRVGRTPPVGSLRRGGHGDALPWRRAVAGAGLIGAGLLLVAAGGATAGVLALVGGLLLVLPMAVHLLGRTASSFPLPGHVALRDAARAPGRSVAAIATVAVATTAAVSAGVAGLSYLDFSERAYEPRWSEGVTSIDLEPDANADTAAELRRIDELARVAAGITGSEPLRRFETFTDQPMLDDEFVDLVVADADLVPRLGYRLDDSALESLRDGDVVLVAADASGIRDGATADLQVRDWRAAEPDPTTTAVVVRRATDPDPDDARRLLMTPETAVAARIPIGGATLVIPGPEPSTEVESELRRAVGLLAPDSAVYVERGYPGNPDLVLYLRLALATAALVVLLTTLTATALSLIDTRRERDLLAATGAAPRTARAIAATTAGAYTLTGAVLGAVTGLALGAIVAMELIPDGDPDVAVRVLVPWPELAVLVLGLPLLLAALAALTTRGGSALAGARAASEV